MKIQECVEKLIGKEFTTKKSGRCSIVDYKHSRDVTVVFHEPLYTAKCSMGNLRLGNVFNPYYPNVYGKGYMGVGKHSGCGRIYDLWNNLLKRTCGNSGNEKMAAYKDATVCEEWLDFQNFANWCEDHQFFNVKDDKGRYYHLDKDILFKGNKIYSPETCCFVPSYINTLFVSPKKGRGEYPKGVSYFKRDGNFRARFSDGLDKSKHLGYFDTPEGAFQAYKKAKESHIKNIAEVYKSQISGNIYEALHSYEVEIDD